MKRPKSMRDVMSGPRSGLRDIMDHAHNLEHLSSLLERHLASSLYTHCRVANYRDKTLVIVTDSPVWSTRLRYELPRLRSELRREPELRELRDIRIRIAPTAVHIPQEPPRPRPISSQSAAILRTVAETIPDNRLRAALLRLSGHAPGGSDDDKP